METSAKPRILVVDDLPENILRISGGIKHLDAIILTSTSPLEGYRISQENDFALLILDVHMPDLNGFELAKLIQSSKKNRNTPIIFVSAVYYDDSSIFKGYESGAVDYLVKPVNLSILESKVKVFLALERSRLELEEAKKEALVAKEEKMMFLAKVGHEIRNPLSAIIGIIELLDPQELSSEWMRRMEMIGDSAQHMQHLLNDLLDLTKMEALALKIVEEPINLRKELDFVILASQVQSKVNSNEIKLEIESNIPRIMLGDALRYKQILLNILGNANKFTHEGLIQLNIELEKEEDDHYIVKTSVHDNGIGIDVEEQGDLFKPFSQLNQSITKKYGGSGLGLVVAKSLTQLLGGDLNFSSEAEEGTLFWFTAKFGKLSDN